MKTKRLLSAILAMTLLISSFATTITASAATTKKTMNMGGGVIAKDDNIYYGYNAEKSKASKFRVLSTSGSATYGDGEPEYDGSKENASKALFVISESDFGTRAFDSDNNQMWQTSETKSQAKEWCNETGDYQSNGFYTAAGITDTEKAAIFTTSKTDNSYDMYKATSINDKVFYLSANEANTYLLDNKIFWLGGEYAEWWWLRSPYMYHKNMVFIILDDGTFYGCYANDSYDYGIASRPAFNLNLSSVLFTSAAVGGKVAGAVEYYDGNEWKLTLKDNSRNFATGNVTRSTDTLTVAYTGAKIGTNEKISYVITDKDQNEIKYYGNQAATSTDGSFEITLPQNLVRTDRLFVFNEQANGDYKTDYASELAEVEIFDSIKLTALVNDTAMGSVTVSPQKPKPGESVTLTATANEKYKLVGFTSDDVEKFWISGNECMFTMPDKNVTVTAVFELNKVDDIAVKNGEIYDLSGKEILSDDIIVKTGGKVKDSSGGKGILKVAMDELYGKNYTDQFPLYDEENGGWRFFDCEIDAGYIEGDNSIIGTTLKFNDSETEAIAKRILASDNSGVSLDITLSETDENGVEHIQTAKAPQSIIKNYAGDLTKPILMSVSGLKQGMTVSVNYRFASGLVISKEVSNATPYITLETGADKSYIVKVYGTGLDGVVIVALYNSENQQKFIDAKIQKIAEFSGQLQGDGNYMKAMWWSDLDTITPLCDAVGKDLKVTVE